MGVLQSILLTHPLIIKTNNGGYKPWINKLDTCTWTGNYHNQVVASGHKYGEMQFYHSAVALLTIFLPLHYAGAYLGLLNGEC